jgi:Flp pilus assembly protein TadD
MAGGVHTRRGELPLTARLGEVARAYQRTLAANPRHPEALVGISLVALASGQTEAAIQMAGAAVAAAPTMETAWVALGQAWKVAGRKWGGGTGVPGGNPAEWKECAGADGIGGTAACGG